MPTWTTTPITGLYLHNPSKIYYARYSLHGSPKWRSLETDTLRTARVKMAEVTVEIATAREQSAIGSSEVKTLGDLHRVFLSRLDTSMRSERTKLNFKLWTQRLITHWPGDFAGTQPNRINRDFIIRLRSTLLAAPFTVFKTKRKGYRPAVVNQSLAMLKSLLHIAEEHHLIFSNPFTEQSVFSEKIWLPKKTKVPRLPSRFDMERVFQALTFADRPERFEEGRIEFLKRQGEMASEHVRFLAYSGARLQEGNAACWEDVRQNSITIRGTKSASSLRSVPIVPEMASLLEEIRVRRLAWGEVLKGPILRVKSSRDALRRACKRVGVGNVTHHGLRHYFVTVCIESAVDIPTIAHWVGHSDGGALLMKTYSHMREAHSQSMGQRVTFGTSGPVEQGQIRTG